MLNPLPGKEKWQTKTESRVFKFSSHLLSFLFFQANKMADIEDILKLSNISRIVYRHMEMTSTIQKI